MFNISNTSHSLRYNNQTSTEGTQPDVRPKKSARKRNFSLPSSTVNSFKSIPYLRKTQIAQTSLHQRDLNTLHETINPVMQRYYEVADAKQAFNTEASKTSHSLAFIQQSLKNLFSYDSKTILNTLEILNSTFKQIPENVNHKNSLKVYLVNQFLGNMNNVQLDANSHEDLNALQKNLIEDLHDKLSISELKNPVYKLSAHNFTGSVEDHFNFLKPKEWVTKALKRDISMPSLNLNKPEDYQDLARLIKDKKGDQTQEGFFDCFTPSDDFDLFSVNDIPSRLSICEIPVNHYLESSYDIKYNDSVLSFDPIKTEVTYKEELSILYQTFSDTLENFTNHLQNHEKLQLLDTYKMLMQGNTMENNALLIKLFIEHYHATFGESINIAKKEFDFFSQLD